MTDSIFTLPEDAMQQTNFLPGKIPARVSFDDRNNKKAWPLIIASLLSRTNPEALGCDEILFFEDTLFDANRLATVASAIACNPNMQALAPNNVALKQLELAGCTPLLPNKQFTQQYIASRTFLRILQGAKKRIGHDKNAVLDGLLGTECQDGTLFKVFIYSLPQILAALFPDDYGSSYTEMITDADFIRNRQQKFLAIIKQLILASGGEDFLLALHENNLTLADLFAIVPPLLGIFDIDWGELPVDSGLDLFTSLPYLFALTPDLRPVFWSSKPSKRGNVLELAQAYGIPLTEQHFFSKILAGLSQFKAVWNQGNPLLINGQSEGKEQ